MVRKTGFTLIELSIVLVIIGLIVGGVLVGRDLITAAQQRKLISEIESLQTSMNTFYGKYACTAGDCTQATTFFGATAPGGAAIVNGDGNALIDQFPNGPYSEAWQFAVQLAAAKLLPGNYTGAAGSGGNRNSVPGKNIPGSVAYEKVGFTLINWAGFTDGSDFTPAVEGNFKANTLLIGKSDSNQYETYAPFLTPANAMRVDQKIDDGKPASGRMSVIAPGQFTNCTTTANVTTATWSSYTGEACSFMLQMGTP